MASVLPLERHNGPVNVRKKRQEHVRRGDVVRLHAPIVHSPDVKHPVPQFDAGNLFVIRGAGFSDRSLVIRHARPHSLTAVMIPRAGDPRNHELSQSGFVHRGIGTRLPRSARSSLPPCVGVARGRARAANSLGTGRPCSPLDFAPQRIMAARLYAKPETHCNAIHPGREI